MDVWSWKVAKGFVHLDDLVSGCLVAIVACFFSVTRRSSAHRGFNIWRSISRSLALTIGHLTVFYMPDAPYADEETGFEVKIGGAYKFHIMRDFPDDESVAESGPVCDCGNTMQTTSTSADVTRSSSADMIALPSAMASPNIQIGRAHV